MTLLLAFVLFLPALAECNTAITNASAYDHDFNTPQTTTLQQTENTEIPQTTEPAGEVTASTEMNNDSGGLLAGKPQKTTADGSQDSLDAGAIKSVADKGVFEVGKQENTTTGEDTGFWKAVTYPCACEDGTCSCCTGKLLENFNINMRQRVCTKLSFDPDDLTIGVRLAWNDLVLYQNKISGKNPPPICLQVPRIAPLRVCLRFNNVYFIGRNIHACLSVESQWNRQSAFNINFDCIRLGTSGVSIVKPEDGGGLPANEVGVEAEPDGIEEYDENVAEPDKPPKGQKTRRKL